MPALPPIAAPSILSADFSRLGDELAIVDETRDWVHCDVMDHQFVPNLTFGPIIVAATRKLTKAFVDVHLMIERPWLMVDEFRASGADQITVHLEACRETREVLRQIRATGAKAGLAIKPSTPYAAAAPYLPDLDLFLVMTVEPGFGGQVFMPEMLDKASAARTDSGEVLSSTCTSRPPGATPKMDRSTSGHRLEPPMPSRSACRKPSECSSARNPASRGSSAFIASTTCSHPRRAAITLRCAGSSPHSESSWASRRAPKRAERSACSRMRMISS
jgi:ribulose-phosphate 3-epimerase